MAYKILPATEQTIAEVEAWLDDEEALYVAGQKAWIAGGYEGEPPDRGFRCNWDTAKQSWRDGRARIDVLLVGDLALGFLDGTDILEVHPAHRKAGYGKALADHMLKVAYEQGRSVVEIGIAPETAVPFWKHMGFAIVPDRQGSGGGIHAFKLLPRLYELGPGERVPYSVSYFGERERFSTDPKPFSEFSGLGERLPDGTIQLPQRAYCYRSTDDQHEDYFVKIEVGGELLHFDKAKYTDSTSHGVERDPGYCFFVDRIVPG